MRIHSLPADPDLRSHDYGFGRESNQHSGDNPNAASERTQAMNTPVVTPDGSISGHREASAKVNANDNTIRAAAGPAVMPGIGRNVNTPATRMSTSANAYNVPSEWLTHFAYRPRSPSTYVV